jgi:hypothetical protein
MTRGSTSVGYWPNRAQETSSPQDWFGVFCVHKSAFGASPGQQDYIVSINSSQAGDTTKIKDIRFLAIKADAADKYASQDASASTASTSYTTRATLTFTPASTGDYLLISSAVLTNDTASNAHGARLNHSGGSIYGENLTYPKAAWTYNAWAGAGKSIWRRRATPSTCNTRRRPTTPISNRRAFWRCASTSSRTLTSRKISVAAIPPPPPIRTI